MEDYICCRTIRHIFFDLFTGTGNTSYESLPARKKMQRSLKLSQPVLLHRRVLPAVEDSIRKRKVMGQRRRPWHCVRKPYRILGVRILTTIPGISALHVQAISPSWANGIEPPVVLSLLV